MDLIVDNLTVDFLYPNRVIPAVCGASTRIRSGRVTGIVGESGSGKSVLAMALLRLLPHNARVRGSCRYGEQELLTLADKPLEELRRSQLALIPQNPYESLNPSFQIQRIFLNALAGFPGSKAEKLARSREILSSLGFADPAEIFRHYSFELSGGMNQRVLAALALVRNPQWIIADEPTKGLDAVLRNEILELFRQIVQNVGSILMITHDLYLAKALCDHLIVMYNGEIVEEGPANLLLGNPAHPYTKGLVNSLPELGMRPISVIRPKGMKGRGCKYYPCCPVAAARCEEENPALYTDGERKVRCFRYD